MEVFETESGAVGDEEAEAEGFVTFEVEGGHADAVALHAGDFGDFWGGEISGPGGEDLVFEVLQPLIALKGPGGGVRRWGGGRGGRDKMLVGGGVDLICGEVLAKHPEVGRVEFFGGG